MYPIGEFSDVEMAFPTDVMGVMPSYPEIPEEFKSGHHRWSQVARDMFYSGMRNARWKPKVGIVEAGKALRHLRYILGSREPKHEHKMAAVAYLLDQWFRDVTYEKGAESISS